MRPRSTLKFYLLTMGILLALSAYPLAMGLKIVFLFWRDGGIVPEAYARYVIPYTAICLSVLITAALHPLLSRLKRWPAPVAIVLALGLFVGFELYMEGIVITNPQVDSVVDYQAFLCVYTPDAVTAFQGVYDDTYKIHYFLVSFVMVALVVNVVYGFGRLASGQMVPKKPLIMQTVVAVIFVGLCVFANRTGFFRLPVEVQPIGSGLLTGLFFVVMGVAAGALAGSWLLQRRKLLAVGLPALVAVFVCLLMYAGEYYMMAGALYRFGRGFFFEGLPWITVAPFDITVVILSGLAAAGVMQMLCRGSIRCDTTGG